MLFELFVVGTFWFWLLIVAELVVLFACAAAETFRYRGALATASLVVTLLALQLFGNVPVWTHINSRTTVRKSQRSERLSWAFYQLSTDHADLNGAKNIRTKGQSSTCLLASANTLLQSA